MGSLLPRWSLPCAVVAGLVVATGCGGSPTPSVKDTAPSEGRIQIRDYAYAPDSVTVEVGTKVVWTNADSTSHIATADDGSFDTGRIREGAMKSVTLSQPGRFAYSCGYHPFMRGMIVVEDGP